jgi:hypothetical protein
VDACPGRHSPAAAATDPGVVGSPQALLAQPQAPAEEVGTADEIAVVGRLVQDKTGRLTVRDFVRGVASLGGFLGRKGDGEPGVRALWRGYQRLQDMVFALHLLNSVAEDSG